MWRQRCCAGCCICTVKDRDFVDPDMSNVFEQWTQQGVQDTTETSSQNLSFGTDVTCLKAATASQPPCREIAVGFNQTQTNIIEYRLGFAITVTGTNSLPGLPGITWSGAYNCNGGRGSSTYDGTTANATSCSISGSGTTVTAHFFAGALEGAVYQGTVADATMPLDITRTPVTVNLISQHDPGLGWPASIVLTGSKPQRQGQYCGIRWWRWYAELLTFSPDGSDPKLKFCYDGKTLAGASLTSVLDDSTSTTTVDGAAAFFLAMKQSGHLAYTTFPTDEITVSAGLWNHHNFSPSLLSLLTWAQYTGNPLVSEQVPYVPDLSPGAAPIVFGVHYALNGSASTKGTQATVRLDNLCILLKR